MSADDKAMACFARLAACAKQVANINPDKLIKMTIREFVEKVMVPGALYIECDPDQDADEDEDEPPVRVEPEEEYRCVFWVISATPKVRYAHDRPVIYWTGRKWSIGLTDAMRFSRADIAEDIVLRLPNNKDKMPNNRIYTSPKVTSVSEEG